MTGKTFETYNYHSRYWETGAASRDSRPNLNCIEEFHENGTIVIPCVSPLVTDKYTASLMSDDREFGQTGAQFLADTLNGKGKIIALDGMDGITVAINRWEGAKSVFDKYPGIEILGKTFADWDYAKGKAASENFLAAFPDIDGVWASGGAMTQGGNRGVRRGG